MSKKETFTIELTLLEIRALLDTSGQMEDDMEYYNFMPKGEYKKFCDAYNTSRTKLSSAQLSALKTKLKPLK